MDFRKSKLLFVIIACIVICNAAIFLKGEISGRAVLEKGGSIKVLFCPGEDCMEELLSLIRNASEVECAFYTAEPEIITLIAEKNHLVVIDQGNYEKSTRGLPPDPNTISVYSEGLMHNKFCVFDGEIVLSGSCNPTKGDNFRNNNNIIIIKSGALAKNYQEKIHQLFVRSYERYTPKVSHRIIVNDAEIENYFCPEDSCSEKVISEITKARSNIYFMTFSFTDDAIGEALIRKNEEGIRISGIFDSQQISNFSEYKKLLDSGIDVSLDSNKYLMHHKVFIIDNETVITGSFNPSANANYRNDENILIINSQDIAKKYLSEFEFLKNANISS